MCAVFPLVGCQSLTSSLDRMMPPWGPPEQWEPEVFLRGSDDGPVGEDTASAGRPVENYIAVFDAANS